MNAGVVGASGYLGAELLRLLAGHPAIDVAAAAGETSAGAQIGELYPSLAPAYGSLVVDPVEPEALSDLDVVFVVLPSGSSAPLVASLVGGKGGNGGSGGPLVVDLGADFRLGNPDDYPTWYGFEHPAPELLATAAYGLPELTRESLVSARLIASAGCYVTAACLALDPFLRSGHVEATGIVVDAASGTSGAGKALSSELHHARVNESFAPYGVLTHRHTPEMQQVLGCELIFTPHLAPMTRGILATCYARLSDTSPLTSTTDALEVLRESYVSEQFVHVGEALVSTADAYGSNVCRLTARLDERTGWLVVFSAIDNLLKGGAGQALQSANVALGLPEGSGLPCAGMAP